MSDTMKTAFTVLRLSAFFVLVGRAWQHIFWDAPYRILFWDEGLLGPFVEGIFKVSWNDYVTHPMTDLVIRQFAFGVGIFYLLCAAICLAPIGILRKLRPALPWATASLVFVSFLYSKDRAYQVGQGVEYACQALAPLFVYFACRSQDFSRRLIFWMKVAIFLTFVGHGLYAVGYYPVPGGFIDMVIAILGVSQENAVRFLFVAGVLDFIVAFAIFIPRWESPALAYAVFWGLATSLARIFANFDGSVALASLHQWSPEVIMRFPHAGIPLALLISLGFAYRDSRKRIKALRFSSAKAR